MITDIQKKWLEKITDGEVSKRDESHKWSVYMGRIRKRIDREFENLVWTSLHFPELLTDEEWEIQELGAIKRRRLKMLMQVIKSMYPNMNPQLIMEEKFTLT